MTRLPARPTPPAPAARPAGRGGAPGVASGARPIADDAPRAADRTVAQAVGNRLPGRGSWTALDAGRTPPGRRAERGGGGRARRATGYPGDPLGPA
ncbi:hypothetical protein ACFU7T_34355 [Streptomyces sp. NPDC057555]|uniref:hypothetical protein n=1 Tax=Streptomyces sp. NPDC057555 TaxID=3346166 RepID=UPI0036A20ACC